MKSLIQFFSLCIAIPLIILYSCERPTRPTLTTTEVTGITLNSAISGGNITLDGGAMVSERGVCWGINRNPTISDDKTSNGTGEGSYSSILNNLTEGTIYYVRAYATNTAGTGYGNEVNFTTKQLITFNPSLTYGTVSDIDGNNYKTVQIETQTWFAENLRATKYRDNTLIPLVTDSATWRNLTTPAYCWYKNDADAYKATYGAIYNWYAVSTGKLCPTGWHIPTQAEVTTLINYLGGINVAGGKLKETGIEHWESPNTGATNSSGFTALPAHERGMHGQFVFIGTEATFWTATIIADYPVVAFGFSINDNTAKVSGYSYFKFGFSIRCLKD
jgi:uncharacterized protein (TIGR02145 family)